MPSNEKSVGAQLKELEKLTKKVIRKSLKDNTLEYAVQASISTQHPGEVRYYALISSPAKGVQPITFVFKTYNELKSALEQSIDTLDRTHIERAFHEHQIDTLESRIQAHKARIVQIDNPEEEEIEMEEV